MRILITSDTVGGVWTYTQELVTGLVNQGHGVTLASFGKLPFSHQAAWMRSLPSVDYRPTEYALEWMETADRDIEESKRYIELLIEEVKPDLLHFSQYCYGDIAVGIPKIVVAHSDVVSWWVAVHGSEPDDTPWIRYYRETVCRGLEGADVVVAPSRWMLESLSNHYFRPHTGMVAYNGRDPSQFDPNRRKENFVLSVGRLWDAGKQVSLLLQREMNAPVRIVGWEHEPGKDGAESVLRVPSSVELLGPKSQSELRDLYARAAIYVATSHYEPFGLAPLEAALSRCVLVLNDNPVFHELWEGAAVFFKKDDPDDLARVVAEVSSNSNLCRIYADLANKRALDQFSADLMVNRYQHIYESVAAARIA
jgi:glycogen(starch) synthase